MKKAKILAVICVAILMFGLIAACAEGGGSGSGSGQVKITYMFWGDETEIANVQGTLDSFNADHPHILVEPWNVDRAEIDALLTTLAASGDLPDTGFLTEQMVIDWARAGFIASPVVSGEAPRDLITYKWEGQPVAYSSCIVQLALYYNRDRFDEAGVAYPPKTAGSAWSWDQFVDAAKSLTFDTSGRNAHDPAFDRNNVERYGFYHEGAAWMLEAWTLANNGGFFNTSNWADVIINNAASAEAIQRIADLHLVHGVMPRWGSLDGTIDTWFLENNVAMAVNGTWSIGVWLSEAMNDHGLNYSVGVLPSMARNVTIATAGLAVQYEGSDHPEEAAEFLAWFGDTQNNWGLIEGGIWMPRYESWFRDESKMREWSDNDNHPPFEDFKPAVIEYSLSNAVSAFWYWVPGADPFLLELSGALTPVWSGEATAQDALNAARPAFVAAIGG